MNLPLKGGLFKIPLSGVQFNTGGFPRLLNKYYYEGFLQDVGERYLSQEEFRLKIEENSKDAKVRFSNFKNLQGNYMIAEIEKNKKTISK